MDQTDEMLSIEVEMLDNTLITFQVGKTLSFSHFYLFILIFFGGEGQRPGPRALY